MLACGIDIIDSVGQVTEVTTAAINFRIPVVGQLKNRPASIRGQIHIILGSQKDQGKSTRFTVFTREFNHAQGVAVECQRSFEITHSYHRMKILHV